MGREQEKIHTIDMLFPLLFIVFFGFCALAFVLSAAGVYEKTTDGLKENYTVRTAAAYLQEKLREYSSAGQVELFSMDGTEGLALYENGDAAGYLTYIYLDDGKLKELFTKEGREISWDSGQELVFLTEFQVQKQDEDLWKIEVADEGEALSFYVRIYGESGR